MKKARVLDAVCSVRPLLLELTPLKPIVFRTDRDGVTLEQALAKCGIAVEKIGDAASEQKNAAAYLELHIEQGPVLENADLPLATVLGTPKAWSAMQLRFSVRKHIPVPHPWRFVAMPWRPQRN